MKKLILLFLVMVSFTSCNPKLYIVGAGMRHHNLSQNKYQPGKHRKKVNVGKNQNSPIFWIFRNL